jgi:hypothetical protein
VNQPVKTLSAWVRAARQDPADPADGTADPAAGSEPAGAGGTAAPAETGSATGWLRDNRVTLVAAALIAIQLLWMAALLSRSYFRQDDFYNFDRALADGFTWKYLMLVSAGHMAPLGFAVSWVLAHVALYDWTLTALVILVLVLAACLALLRVLRTLFGNRPAILIPLMVYLFSPLALAAVDWWSVAIQTLPLEIAIFMAVDAHVRYLREGRIRQLAAAAGWLLLGMATVQKGAVVPVLLFGLTSAFFTEGGWLSGIGQAARRYWRAWVVYGSMLAAYLVLFLSVLPTSTTPPTGPGPAERVLTFVTTLTGTTLVPGAVGGPWHWSVLGDGNAQASSPAALQQLSWALAVLVIAVSIAFRPRAARAWAILAGWIVAADVLPVVIGRLGSADPHVLGLQARYVTDAAAVLALCLALAFLPLAGQEGGYRFAGPALAPGRPGRIATAAVLAVFLAGSFWSLQSLTGLTDTRASRSYIATARAAVTKAPRGTLVADGPTLPAVMDPLLFLSSGNTSRVVGALARGPLAGRLTWLNPPRGVVPGLMIFNLQGQLRPAVLLGRSTGPPSRGRCWPLSLGAAVSIPLPGPLYRWTWTVGLDYNGPATEIDVRFGGQWAHATLPAGRHHYYVPLTGSGRAVDVALASAAPGGCLTGLTVGTWQPARSGPAIPRVPVPG